ncbi:hypothetical protein [Salinimicrobium xinjiangense]|uniref:hypothetical protein n=1 Tax=Salinimicrobium xinjiangense TaxID=438596 RepID=UPI000420DE18|nr:hypothetical protein [Salinimicrobium xinjiangense]
MTYTGLRKKFEECTEDWNKNIKEESYKELTRTWSLKSPAQKEGMRLMIDYLSENFYNNLDYILEEQRMEYDDRLFYCISTEEKIDLVQERLLQLKALFTAKGMFLNLLPSSFPENSCYSRFPHMVFNSLPTDVQDQVIKLSPKNQEDWIIQMERLMSDFHEYEFAIVEFLYLKSLFQDLQIEKGKLSDMRQEKPLLKNEYPEIFLNEYAYHLFNHIVQDQKKKEANLGPALLTKLFDFFKDEDFIYKKVKPMPYLKFLKNKHNIDIKKLDKRVAADSDDIDLFKKLKKSFTFKPNSID